MYQLFNDSKLCRYFRSPHEHSLPNQHECRQKVIRHHQNGRTLTVECQTLPREAHPPGGEARHPPLAAATHPPSMGGGPPCTVGRDQFPIFRFFQQYRGTKYCWKNPKSMIFCSRVHEQLYSRLVIFSDFGLGQPKRHFFDTFFQFWP